MADLSSLLISQKDLVSCPSLVGLLMLNCSEVPLGLGASSLSFLIDGLRTRRRTEVS